MRYISAFGLLTVLTTSIFAQSVIVETSDNPITGCFPNALIIVPSEKTDPFMIVKPSDKIDRGILSEILCPNEISTGKNKEDLPPAISLSANKKP